VKERSNANERPCDIKERTSQEHTQQTPLSPSASDEESGASPHFVIEHVPELLGRMFIPAENMRGQASMGAGCGVFLIPRTRDKNKRYGKPPFHVFHNASMIREEIGFCVIDRE
jgi:hypothetical protein